jgi:hypothetical protein
VFSATKASTYASRRRLRIALCLAREEPSRGEGISSAVGCRGPEFAGDRAGLIPPELGVSIFEFRFEFWDAPVGGKEVSGPSQ